MANVPRPLDLLAPKEARDAILSDSGFPNSERPDQLHIKEEEEAKISVPARIFFVVFRAAKNLSDMHDLYLTWTSAF